MEVKLHYSKAQMDAAVKFIAENNPSYINQYEGIRSSIWNHINELVEMFPDMTGIATMGYWIEASIESVEGIDEEENILRLEIWVNPSIGKLEDTITQTFNITPNED
jgi:hypothetical protein